MLDVDRVRADFPILGTKVNGRPLVYFDNSATAQKPVQVMDAVREAYEVHNSNIHRGVHHLSDVMSGLYEDARNKVAIFINAREEEVLFTAGTTQGINMLAACLAESEIGKGDVVLLSEMEHHSNIIPWQMACAKVGASIRVLPIKDDGSISIDALSDILDDKVKLLAISQVSNVLGIVNPIKELTRACHENGTLVMVDGAQSVPHLKTDVKELDCDFLVFSGHKLHAETGIGVLFGKKDLLEDLPPTQGGGGMVDKVTMTSSTYAEVPQRFESGTPNYVGAISLAAAIDYMMSLGMDDIIEHEKVLNGEMMRSLGRIDGVTVYGNGAERCPIYSFNIRGLHPYDIGQILDKMGIAVRTGNHCAQPLMARLGISGTVRASLSFYNTVEEISDFIDGLEKAVSILE